MKNIIMLFSVFFCFSAVAAPNKNDIFAAMPDYLIDTARAWGGIYSEFGPSAEISSYIDRVQNTDVARYLNAISILGFNNTAMALFETIHHIDAAFDILNSPMDARRGLCVANFAACDNSPDKIAINGRVFGNFAGYNSDLNGDFNTSTTGFAVNVHGYVTDGLMLGVSYARTMTDTHDTRIYSDATGNSLTAFVKYLARSGFFVNFGANMGGTGWDVDKNIYGTKNDGTYDTDFYSAQMNAGIRITRGRISMIPMASVRYWRASADKYIDDAGQSFGKWWYNTLNASVGANIGFDFSGSDFIIRPSIYLGGGYDLISNGTDNIHVQLVGPQSYNIPVEAPHRALFRGKIGIELINNYFNTELNYALDMRSGYVAHTIMANAKVMF